MYKGMVPNVMRVLPSSAITFIVYEGARQLLEEMEAHRAGSSEREDGE